MTEQTARIKPVFVESPYYQVFTESGNIRRLNDRPVMLHFLGGCVEIDPLLPAKNRLVQVLALGSLGLSVEQTARTMYLSPHTVKSHRRSLFSNLEVRDMGAAIDRAFEQDIFKVTKPAQVRKVRLTERKLDVMAAAAKGLTAEGTAARMGIAESSARSHRAQLIRQLGVTGMDQAVLLGYLSGDLPLGNGDESEGQPPMLPIQFNPRENSPLDLVYASAR